MRNHKIKTSFVSPEGPKAVAYNFMINILISMENYLQYDAIHNFSVLLRTSSNPADIDRFRSHTEKYLHLKLSYIEYTAEI